MLRQMSEAPRQSMRTPRVMRQVCVSPRRTRDTEYWAGTATRPPDVPLASTVITRGTPSTAPPPPTRPRRRRRNTGLRRWPTPDVQFATLFRKRTEQRQTASGQLTCSQHYEAC